MRRIFIFPLVFLFFFLGSSYFSQKTNAAGCSLTVAPQAISANYNQDLTITSQGGCFTDKNYQVYLYPQPFGSIKIAFNSSNALAFQRNVEPTPDKKILVVNLASTFFQYLIKSLEGKSLGQWTISVCSPMGNITTCDEQGQDFVGKTTITVGPPAPSPTPTPQPDQPILDASPQSICTYGSGEDVKIKIKNPEPNGQYLWWWNEQVFKAIVGFSTSLGLNPYPPWGSAFTFIDPDNPTSEKGTNLIINGSRISSDLGNGVTNLNGHLLCVDKAYYGTTRIGANCLWLYFKPALPKELKIDPACSKGNSGAVTPTPVSPLPPCAQWLQSDGKTPVPTTYYNDPTAYPGRTCATVDTGLKIPLETDPAKFVKNIFSILLSIVGGIAVLLIIYSGYQLMVSQGNPEKIKEAQEQLTSAIVGLLFIIFSLAILQIIGVDILKIPGFQ